MCEKRRKYQRIQPTDRRTMCALLSCHLIWGRFLASIRHRHFSFIAVKRALSHAMPRSSAKVSRSGTPCTLAGSSAGALSCTEAAFEPPRHMSLSDLRGSITGVRAWSGGAGHKQDIVLPVSKVCTISHPLARSSSISSAVTRTAVSVSPS